MDSLVLLNGAGTSECSIQAPAALIEKLLVNDIIDEIFRQLVYTASTSPFTVSQVCHRWRAIALQDSTLWNCMNITEDCINQTLSGSVRHSRRPRKTAKPKTALPSAFPRIELMLQRSISQAVEISITVPRPGSCVNRWDVWHTKMLAALLKPHAPRFRTLYLQSFASWQHHALLLDVLRGRELPTLVDLSIYRWYDDWQELTVDFDDATYAEQACTLPSTEFSFIPGITEIVLCPSLQRIVLTGSYQDWDRFVGINLVSITISKLPWSARPTVVQLRRVLEMSSATLTSLDLMGALPYVLPEGEDVLPPVALTNLSQLTLQYTMPIELAVFQSAFLVPALKQVYIRNANRQDPDFAEENLIYTDTLNSFAALLATFPFTQIDDFALHGAQFGPPPMDIPTEEEILTARAELTSLPVPFQLVQQLKKAKKVHLDNPDQFLLMGMLYPQLDMVPKDYGKEDQDPEMPPIPIVLANAKELCFDVYTDDQAHRGVLQYLSDRVKKYVVREEDGRILYVNMPVDVLELFFPRLMPAQFDKEDWKGTELARTVRITHGPAFSLDGSPLPVVLDADNE